MIEYVQVNGRRYAQIPPLQVAPGLVHAICTRPMNVAPSTDPAGAEQRRIMATDWGFDAAALAYCEQIHQTELAVIDGAAAGGQLLRYDGAVTRLANVPLMTFSADCPPVLVYDPGQRVLGVAHASWRCTVGRIVSRLVERMVARFACRPAQMVAGIGPGAGPCCYEVRDDVYRAAGELADCERLFVRRGDRMYFDLWKANQSQLLEAGLRAENVASADVCTMCSDNVFYSYRREGPGCGHFGLIAGMREA